MKIGLVLGGGGARGLAHIGVLEVLLERGYKPIAIAGCSMGGIIGALFAAGKSPKEIHDIADNLPYLKLLDMGKMGALMGGKGIEKFLQKHLPENFEDLAIPLTVTAVDVQEGKLVVLNEGALVSALRATSALPGLITPEIYEDHENDIFEQRVLIDGGLLNNLPVDLIRTMTPCPVIAVDVAAPANRRLEFEHEKEKNGKNSKDFSLRERFRAVMSGDFFEDAFQDMFKRSLTIELFMKSFDVPQHVLTETRLAMNPPDVLLRPRLARDFGVEDFMRFEEAYARGREIAEEVLDSDALPMNLRLSSKTQGIDDAQERNARA